jgi:hypothetical protein
MSIGQDIRKKLNENYRDPLKLIDRKCHEFVWIHKDTFLDCTLKSGHKGRHKAIGISIINKFFPSKNNVNMYLVKTPIYFKAKIKK